MHELQTLFITMTMVASWRQHGHLRILKFSRLWYFSNNLRELADQFLDFAEYSFLAMVKKDFCAGEIVVKI